MDRFLSRFFMLAAAAVAALLPAGAMAQAQYPSKAVRVVVPFAPGGVVDTVGRLWAQRVGPALGTIVVDNRGGAGGAIGTAEVARAQPDGYTLLLGNTSTQVLNPARTKVPYDPVKDFVTIDIIAVSATAVIVHPSLPVRDLKSLIAYAKKNAGKLSYGSAGAGTVTHLAGEMLKQRAGLDITHVPYKGAGPGIIDLVSGYVPIMTPNITGQLLSLHETGKVRILAVNAPQRLKGAPDIPTAQETLPDMIALLFTGLFAPAGTPQAVVNRVSQVTRKALADPEFENMLVKSGLDPVLDSSPEKAQHFVDQEQARLVPLIKAMDLKQ